MYGKSRAKWYEETMIFDAKFNGMMQTISTYQTIENKVLNK
jgi:hypothetical protein